MDSASPRAPQPAADSFWTEVKYQRVRQMWDDRWSAKRIGDELGCSKNAVVSCAKRLGLAGRPSPIIRQGYRGPRRVYGRRTTPVPKPRIAPMPENVVVPAKPVGKVGRCAWPMWGNVRPREPVFCCADTLPDKPYCGCHAAKAYRQVPALSEAAA